MTTTRNVPILAASRDAPSRLLTARNGAGAIQACDVCERLAVYGCLGWPLSRAPVIHHQIVKTGIKTRNR